MEQQTPPLTAFRKSQDPKLTLKDLADRLDISEGHLSRVEREGTANFSLALKLAELTKLPVETFAPKTVEAGKAA